MTTYRVTDPDYRVITTLGRGRDTYAMACEAVAMELGCDPDDLKFEDELDPHGEPTGEDLIKLDGKIVGRFFQSHWE